MTDFVVHPLERGEQPAWASAWGHDGFGVWAAFAVGDGEHRAVQRMRWIVPGDFIMGSPDDESGRFEWEGPRRRVRISRGFWLADTPCTQSLWTAVTGENPSKFEGEQRPVDKVSFDDVQQFCCALGERVPGLSPRLPTEAEWEYACRAGFDLPVYPLPGQSIAADVARGAGPGALAPAPQALRAYCHFYSRAPGGGLRITDAECGFDGRALWLACWAQARLGRGRQASPFHPYGRQAGANSSSPKMSLEIAICQRA